MNESEMLKAVLSILAQAKFDVKGSELMQVANVLHDFSQFVKARDESVVSE
jgi:hypothetical protein